MTCTWIGLLWNEIMFGWLCNWKPYVIVNGISLEYYSSTLYNVG